MARLLAGNGRWWLVVIGNDSEGGGWRDNGYGERRVENNNSKIKINERNKIKRNQKKGIWIERKGGKMRKRKKWGLATSGVSGRRERGEKKILLALLTGKKKKWKRKRKAERSEKRKKKRKEKEKKEKNNNLKNNKN